MGRCIHDRLRSYTCLNAPIEGESNQNVCDDPDAAAERALEYVDQGFTALKFDQARANGFFTKEITAVEIKGRRGERDSVIDDEHPRPDTEPEKIAKLKPLSPEGVVTAANTSEINDGPAALAIGNKDIGEQTSGPAPKTRIIAGAISGVAPRTMGIVPAYAIPKALQRADSRLLTCR